MARMTVTLFSEALGVNTHVEIIFPNGGKEKEKPKRVLYLLHGMYGGCTDWVENTRITHYAKRHNFIVVMPEVMNSFYTDMAYGGAYFTYVAHELPKMVEFYLNVKHTRKDTYIAGLSMGGYGAVKIAFNRPEFFTACASFSGAMDVARLYNNFSELPDERKKLVISIAGTELKVAENNDLFHMAAKLSAKARKPRVLLTCGTDDFLLDANRKFDRHMAALSFGYTYKEWPGTHDWDFWEDSLPVMFDFFMQK